MDLRNECYGVDRDALWKALQIYSVRGKLSEQMRVRIGRKDDVVHGEGGSAAGMYDVTLAVYSVYE